MSRWKALPEELDPRVRQLVGQLRRLKEVSGLSLAQVASKTGYSKSSWERYLAGKTLPPQQAVESFAQVCGADPARLLALQEVVAEVWGATKQEGPQPSVPVEPVKALRRRPVQITAIVGVAVVVAAIVLLTVRPWQDSHRAAASAGYTCHFTQTDHRWYAGHSTTQTAIVQQGMAGTTVAEVQCLLQHAGFSPGTIDGIYGDLTQRAVKREQAKHGLVADGVVGPHTWGALRG